MTLLDPIVGARSIDAQSMQRGRHWAGGVQGLN